MCSASPGRWMNWDDKPLSDNHRRVSVASATNLKRLEEVFARRVLLTLIHHRVGGKVREPIVRFVPMVEQDPVASVRVLAEAIRNSHIACRYSRDDG